MIVSISGRIGSGKDTVGEIIQQLRPQQGYEVKKWAGKLKDIVCLLLGCTREQIEDREFKEKELGEEWDVIRRGGNNSLLHPDDFPELEYEKLTPRKLLQLLGTECGREIIHPNIWVNALMIEYKREVIVEPISEENRAKYNVGFDPQFQARYDYPNWLITDTRFPNELEAVKQRGGVTLRIVRDTDDKEATHASETALDNAKFDYTIRNNGTIEDLTEEVKIFLEHFPKI